MLDLQSAETGQDVVGDDAVAKEPRDWRLEYLREVGQSRKYRQRAQKAEAELSKHQERALAPQQYEEYQRLRQRADEAAEQDARMERLQAKVRRLVASGELSKALVDCGVAASAGGGGALAHAAQLLADRIQVDLSGEEAVVRVLDESGRPMLRQDSMEASPSEPVTVQEFVAQWLTEEGAHFLPPSGDTGSGAHKGCACVADVSVTDLDRDPRRKAQFIATFGPQAYVQLARRKHK